MTIRMYASPVDLLGPATIPPKAQTGYYPRIWQYATRYRAIVSSKDDTDGSPALSWVVAIGQAADWTAADADAEMRLIAEFPSSVTNFQEAKVFLKGQTVGDLSAALRTRFQNIFDALGINRSDFTLATPLFKVWKRLCSSQLEAGDNFSDGPFIAP